MKNIFHKLLIISTLVIALSSCSNITNDVVTAGDKPVIEGYLVPNQPVNITITQEIPYTANSSTTATPINNLSVLVKDDLGITYSLKSVGNGLYQSGSKELVKVGRSYTMQFTYNNKLISATTTIPTTPQNFAIDRPSISRTQINLSTGSIVGTIQQDDNTPVTATWTNATSDYYFLVADNLETTPNLVVIPPTTADSTIFKNLSQRFRQQPVQAALDQMRPQSFQYFGNYHVILFHINSDYAALYQSSGTTTQNISTPLSTIANGLGIFTGVNSDTLSFKVIKR